MSELDAVRAAQSYAGWVPRQAVDATIAALEADRDAATALMEDFRQQMQKARVHAKDCERLVKSCECELDEKNLRVFQLEAETARLRSNVTNDVTNEADAIIPLNDQQAEAFKALSESIKTEQSLRDEVARLNQIIKVNEAEPERLQRRPPGRGRMRARVAELEAEARKLRWMLDTAISDMASVGAAERHFFDETSAEVRANLLARYEAEHDA